MGSRSPHARTTTMARTAAWMASLLVLFTAFPAGAQQRDITKRWKTVRSEHFEVNYPEPLALVARRVLWVAERAHEKLEPLLRHEPRKRVQIVLNDDVDAANGTAAVLPYNVVQLFVTAPDDLSVLSDFDDWLTVLITHEHSHILHLDNIGGLPRVVNHIFGKIWAPNLIQPRWIIEGIATYYESELTASGRLHSTIFEMYMRMAVLEDNIVHFDTLNNNTDYWPRGNIWYLYGSRFVKWMVDRYGEDIIPEMAKWYGRRAIPFSVNRMAKRLTGKTFDALYKEWIADMRVHYGNVAESVRSEGVVEGRRLTFTGETVRGAALRGRRTPSLLRARRAKRRPDPKDGPLRRQPTETARACRGGKLPGRRSGGRDRSRLLRRLQGQHLQLLRPLSIRLERRLAA